MPSSARYFQLASFTQRRFAGNPAAVMLMDRFPEGRVLQSLTSENNLAETAFIVTDGADFQIRRFTPVVEVSLCGHATLASAAVVMRRFHRCPGHAGGVIGDHSSDRALIG